MQIGYFVEQLYSDLPENEIIQNGVFIRVPKQYYHSTAEAKPYNRCIREDLDAEP